MPGMRYLFASNAQYPPAPARSNAQRAIHLFFIIVPHIAVSAAPKTIDTICVTIWSDTQDCLTPAPSRASRDAMATGLEKSSAQEIAPPRVAGRRERGRWSPRRLVAARMGLFAQGVRSPSAERARGEGVGRRSSRGKRVTK